MQQFKGYSDLSASDHTTRSFAFESISDDVTDVVEFV